MLRLPAIDEAEDCFQFSALSTRKTATFFKISRSSRKTRLSHRNLFNSARSWALPPVVPFWISYRCVHLRSELLLTPSSSATWCRLLPPSRKIRTASAVGCSEQGKARFVLAIGHSSYPST